MAGRKKAHDLANQEPISYKESDKVSLKKLEDARDKGERLKLRIMVPGHDRKPQEYTQTILYGNSTFIGFVPWDEKPKAHRGVQMCHTVSLDYVRLFDKSQPLSRNY